MFDTTCCVTGLRDIPASRFKYVRDSLQFEIETAISDGYTRFMSGFADGADLICAVIISEIKRLNPRIELVAVLPSPARTRVKNTAARWLLDMCDSVKVLCDSYDVRCYNARNRYLVEQSSRVIAAYDGSPRSNTGAIVRMATARKRELRVIGVKTNPVPA